MKGRSESAGDESPNGENRREGDHREATRANREGEMRGRGVRRERTKKSRHRTLYIRKNHYILCPPQTLRVKQRCTKRLSMYMSFPDVPRGGECQDGERSRLGGLRSQGMYTIWMTGRGIGGGVGDATSPFTIHQPDKTPSTTNN